MQVKNLVQFLHQWAPPAHAEGYDNVGLIIGDATASVSGILCTLDVTSDVIDEALATHCNVIVAHHPPIFSGLKQLTGANYTQRLVAKALVNNLHIIAVHTNLDNQLVNGVSSYLAQRLQLQHIQVLVPKAQTLAKLVFYCPSAFAKQVAEAAFSAGAGTIGNYSECSFTTQGTGTFTPNQEANPQVGQRQLATALEETAVAVLVQQHLAQAVIAAVKNVGFYEEVAYDYIPLLNTNQTVGSGIVGTLQEPLPLHQFLEKLQGCVLTKAIKYTQTHHSLISKIAICGGSGASFIPAAAAQQVQAYVTADLKYHDYFIPDGAFSLIDIGHYESEQFTSNLLAHVLQHNFPNFAVLKSKINTNPVQYFV